MFSNVSHESSIIAYTAAESYVIMIIVYIIFYYILQFQYLTMNIYLGFAYFITFELDLLSAADCNIAGH